jgi:GNAT superfamily N-acetyltransferase
MPPILTLRRAERSDLEALVQMRMALLREVGNIGAESGPGELAAVVEAHKRYFSESIPAGKYLGIAAQAEGKVVGTGGLVLLERPPYRGNLSGVEGYLMNIYTVPNWRGKGVASAVVDQILALAKQSEVKRVWLHAEPEARRIYEKAGFVAKTSEMEIFFSSPIEK